MEKATLALQKERKIVVFNPVSKIWVLTDFEKMQDGDIFKIIQDGVRYTDPVTGDNIWVANGEPYQDTHGWQINTY